MTSLWLKDHAVLKCNSCSKSWNRDIMTAKTMRFSLHGNPQQQLAAMFS
jgi:hypothetical protein